MASKAEGVSKLELYPIDAGDGPFTLDRMLILGDPQAASEIVGEISFPEEPQLPGPMQHSRVVAAFKMVVFFNNETSFCLCVWYREGGAGNGVEFAANPNLNLSSLFHNDLPGHDSLGRGYSVNLSKMLLNEIRAAGGKWVQRGMIESSPNSYFCP